MMRKKLLAFVLAAAVLTACSGTAAFAFASESGGTGELQFATQLSVRTPGAAVTTAAAFTGAYAYEVNFRTYAADPNANVLTVDLGWGQGTHALRVTVQARGVAAYVIGTDTGVGTPVEVTGSLDFPVMTEPAMGWMQLGATDYKFKFVTREDRSGIELYCARAQDSYFSEPNGIIQLANEDENKDYARFRPTDGQVRLLPDLHNSFYINKIEVNGAALDLKSGDVRLSNTGHFSDRYTLADFAVDAAAPTDVKAVTPFRVSTAGFGAGEEVFSVTYDIHRGKTDGAPVWTTTADFGMLFGMKDPSDVYTSEGVGSILNGADYKNYPGALSSGYTVMAVGKGDGTVAEKLALVGRHNEETGAGSVIFRGNDLATGNVRVTAVGYGDGSLSVTYTEAVGHDAAVVTTAEVAGLNLDGYLALYCQNAAIHDEDEIKFHNISFTVNEYVLPESVTMDKAELTVKRGESAALTATVLPENATDDTVLWESSAPKVAAVDENGLVTGVSFGTATITARSRKDADKFASCSVSVLEPVTGVTLDCVELALDRGKTGKLTAAVAPAGKCDASVRWESDNEEVATVSADGTVTARAKGTAKITATTADGGFTASCSVSVRQPATGIELDRETAELTEGDTLTLTAAVFPGNADDRTVVWESGDTAVATVADGVVTAVKEGTATITAKCGALTASCAVTVKKRTVEVTGIALSDTEKTLSVNGTFVLTAVVSPENATDQTVSYASDNEEVASVSADGTVTAHKAGTAVITVTAGGKSAACTVTVAEENEPQPSPEPAPSCGCGTLSGFGSFGGGALVVAAACAAFIVIKKKSVRIK